MKTLINFLYAGVLAGGAATSVAGPVSNIDTSILKNGNTWVYAYSKEERSAGQLQNGYNGTIRFTIDSLVVDQDTVKFKVIRRDVGQHLIWAVGWDPIVDTTQSSSFTFRGGAYSPSAPFFAVDQFFEGTESKVVYHGDTLFKKTFTTGGGAGSCAGTNEVNIQKIGRMTDGTSHGGCGTTSGHTKYDLMEFNGGSVGSDSVTPVSIRRPVATGHKSIPTLSQGKNKVFFEKNGTLYDGRGSKIPESATKR